MLRPQFNQLRKQLPALTDEQIDELSLELKGKDRISQIITHLEQRLVDSPCCPHCSHDKIIRFGKQGNMQRYRCKHCLKTSVSTTKTPLARLRYKARWFDYFGCMLESKVLRSSAKKCNISLKTAFRWRHRFLHLPAMLKAQKLEGIIEADETFFRYSQKGQRNLARKPRKRGTKATARGLSAKDWVPVLTARDRAKNTFEAILPKVTSSEIEKQLAGKLVKDCVFCSDGHKAYIKFTNENNLIHRRLNLAKKRKVIDKVFHIQNVNAYHSRLKRWIARFHGVATKYLDNYLGWHRFMDAHENLSKNRLFEAQQRLTGT